MKKIRVFAAALLVCITALSLEACGGESSNNDIKSIEKPKTAATSDEADVSTRKDAVEASPNVNGKRFNLTLHEFTTEYNDAKDRRKENDRIFFGNWKKNSGATKDDNGVDIQYWYYNDDNVSFTATVEVASQKLVNIGCGTTMSKFMGMDGDRKNSDIILGKAALMAEIACGFEEGSETVLQDIFFKTTTESDDSLWYKGYVFNMSTKEDDNDSKNNIMLFRVFPVTDSLKNEWKLKEYS